MIKDHKDLVVWQKAMDLVIQVYKIVKTFPIEEKYGLSDQMRRAAVSIPSNIAEGYQRGSDRELSHFLRIALGSSAELETQLILCGRLGLAGKERTDEVIKHNNEIGKMLNAFIKKLTADG